MDAAAPTADAPTLTPSERDEALMTALEKKICRSVSEGENEIYAVRWRRWVLEKSNGRMTADDFYASEFKSKFPKHMRGVKATRSIRIVDVRLRTNGSVTVDIESTGIDAQPRPRRRRIQQQQEQQHSVNL